MVTEYQQKSNTAYKTISEVAKTVGVTTATIRFWEREFKQIKPYIINKRRYYLQENIDIIAKIKKLLHQEGYTLNGAKKYFKNLNITTPNTKNIQLDQKLKQIIELLHIARKELGEDLDI